MERYSISIIRHTYLERSRRACLSVSTDLRSLLNWIVSSVITQLGLPTRRSTQRYRVMTAVALQPPFYSHPSSYRRTSFFDTSTHLFPSTTTRLSLKPFLWSRLFGFFHFFMSHSSAASPSSALVPARGDARLPHSKQVIFINSNCGEGSRHPCSVVLLVVDANRHVSFSSAAGLLLLFLQDHPDSSNQLCLVSQRILRPTWPLNNGGKCFPLPLGSIADRWMIADPVVAHYG